jgi:BCD family chlorophyll transporter-like MFS transporter
MTVERPLSWLGIVRLGLVQTALGAIVVLTTSTLNRVMVVEIALPAIVPGLLVALHYAVQLFRPRMGYGSDVGGRRTPWIVGGMAMLASGGVLAAVATAWMTTSPSAGIGLAVVAFFMIGLGVGASGTTLLVLLAKRTDERRRPAAATIVWVMMILGFIVTAGIAGHLLDPFSPTRLVMVASGVAVAAMIVTLLAIWNIEGSTTSPAATVVGSGAPSPTFRQALRDVWEERQTRQFGIFVFISMIAYSAQDLILEPFAGVTFGYTPGETTKLSGIQNSGVLTGMILVALTGSGIGGRRFGSLRMWTFLGCILSAIALLGLVGAGLVGPAWPLRVNVFALGFANGVYAVGAIGSMMDLVGKGTRSREGVRMGLWGAAQAIAFGCGGVLGALASDIARLLLGAPGHAYATVFAAEALLFVVAAGLALRTGQAARETRAVHSPKIGGPLRATDAQAH